jgi:ankyrin repeat protein
MAGGAVSPPLTPTPSPGRSALGTAAARATNGDGARKEPPPPTRRAGTLLAAASIGDERAAAWLLEQGAPIEDADPDGWTALLRAAAVGHEAIVRLLLDHGASTLPLFAKGREVHSRQSRQSGRSTPLHYKELFGEASIVNMLVAAAAAAVPSADSESMANALRSATYGLVLLLLRALQPQANQKAIAARLAAQPTAPLQRAKPLHAPVKGAWSVSYDQFVRQSGETVANQVLQRGRPYPERRILPPAPAPPRKPPAPPFKQSLPPSLMSTSPLPVHDPVRTGAHWYNSADGAPTELEGVASVPTQMPETPVESPLEWSTDPLPLQKLPVARCHADLEIGPFASHGPWSMTTTVTRVRDSLWELSHRKAFGVAVTSFPMTEGRHYIECRVLTSASSGFLIGVAQSGYDPDKDPEFAGLLWAFDSFDGSLHHARRSYKWNGMEPAAQGDCIGVHLDSDRGLLTIYKNGRKLGVMCGGLRGETLSWAVPLWDVGDCVQITPLSEPTVEDQPLPLDASTEMQLQINEAGLTYLKSGATESHKTVAKSSLTTGSSSLRPSPPAAVTARTPTAKSSSTGQQTVSSPRPSPPKGLSDTHAQAIIDAEAARAGPRALHKLRSSNEQALITTKETAAENEKFLAVHDAAAPLSAEDGRPTHGQAVPKNEEDASATIAATSNNNETAERAFEQEANFQLSRFLKFSEQGEVTLLIPKLSEICRKILSAMTTRQLINLAQRRHVSVLDCPSCTKLELQALVQKAAAVPEKQLYVDLDNVDKEFRQRLHYHHRSAAVTRPELMVFLKELGADPALYYDKQKVVKKLTEHWAGKELKKFMLSDKSKPSPRNGQELVSDPAALLLSHTEWIKKLEKALGWIAPGTIFLATDSQNWITVGFPDGESGRESGDTVHGSTQAKRQAADGAVSASTRSSSLRKDTGSTVIGSVPLSSAGARTPGEDECSVSAATLSPVDAPSVAEQQQLVNLETELRSLVIEAKDAATTANSAAIAIVKRGTAASQAIANQQQPGVAAATADELPNKAMMLKLKRQEEQIMRLTRQLEDVRVEMERANPQPVQPIVEVEDEEEEEKPADPVTEAEFRAAASQNQVNKMAELKAHDINIDAADDLGTDHRFSNASLRGFTALHHATFGEHGPSLDAMTRLLLWKCRTDIEDATGITARGYAVDPRAAALLDLVTTKYVAQKGDPGYEDAGLLPDLVPTMSRAEKAEVLIAEVWPYRLQRAERHAAILEASAVGNEAALVAALGSDDSVDPDLIDCIDGFGQTPLCWAAHQGHTHIVKKLLQYNADILKGSYSSVGNAAGSAPTEGHPTDAVRGNFLSPRGTPFLNACRGGHADIANILGDNGVDPAQLEMALAELKEREADDSRGVNKWDVFCHWVPAHPDTAAERKRVTKGLADIRTLLKGLYAHTQNVDMHEKKPKADKRKGRTPRPPAKARAKSPGRGKRLRSSSPKKKRRSPAPATSRLPPAQVAAALAGPGGMQAMLLSPTALGTLSDGRATELAADYEKQVLEAAKAAADGAVAVAAYIRENGTPPPPPEVSLEPKPPDGSQLDATPRFTKLHRELRLSRDGQQVEKKKATTHGQWRTALCAGSKMIMRRGGGGVAEDYYADFIIRTATGSERRLGEAEGLTGLDAHPHHNTHHHHRALPRNITIGVAHRTYSPDTPGRGTSSQHCWGYCAHSGLCRHAGRAFDWGGRTAAVPGDTLGLHLRLPETGDGGGTLSVFLNGELLGEMCEVPAGEYVWMVENGDPGESVQIRAGAVRGSG